MKLLVSIYYGVVRELDWEGRGWDLCSLLCAMQSLETTFESTYLSIVSHVLHKQNALSSMAVPLRFMAAVIRVIG